jgi:hypothetical protein
MKAFRFFIGIWIFTLAYGFFGWNTESNIKKDDVLHLETKKVLPEHICLFYYPYDIQNSHHTVVRYPAPPRNPRRGMTPKELAHAHLLVTYRECDCFHPTTTEGWNYLETCVRYFSDLDKKYKELLELKNQI